VALEVPVGIIGDTTHTVCYPADRHEVEVMVNGTSTMARSSPPCESKDNDRKRDLNHDDTNGPQH
jgi:hypothetical protein